MSNDAFDVEGRARGTTVVLAQGLVAREGGRNKQGRPQEAQVRTLERSPQEREVVLHPKIDSDLASLPQKAQDTFHERVEMLRRGERHSSTHTLNGPLKGWQATSVGGTQHRMVHRYDGGDLQVLSVGNHDEAYNQGKRRAVAAYTGLEFRDGVDHDLMDDPRIEAHHPEHGMVGHLTYRVSPPKPAWGLPHGAVSVQQLEVHPDHRRNGVAQQLLHELEKKRFPTTPVEHGQKTEDGKAFSRATMDDDSDNRWTIGGERMDPPRHFSTLAHFTPKLRVFTHTCGLDHRLWDATQHLKPEVRKYILQSINKMWGNEYKEWSKWARVYFAGSEASEWTSEDLEGNDDFDVLIGVDYDKFRKYNPAFRDWSNAEITGKMNPQFRQYNGQTMLKIDGVEYGPFDRTTYVNPDSYDIRKIKPYAAYDVGKNEWVVKPPHLPHWSLTKLDSAVQLVLRASDTLARNTLKLSEPERTQQGAALFDAWHSDRSRAFGPNGQGWWDIANLREKWLDQAGLWAQIVDCKHKFDQGLGAAAPDWSNTPRTAMLKLAMPWENQDPDVNRPRPKSVRRAGFAGFASDKQWVRQFGDNGQEADQPDHVDEHLGHFISHHSPNWSAWGQTDRGVKPVDIDLKKPVYATQSHVSQFHIDRYKKKPTDVSWAQKGEEDHDSEYPGHHYPLFVTHQGRTHVIEGHHRVAAALQRGEPTIRGLHRNLDEEPIVQNHRGDDCPRCTHHEAEGHAEAQKVASMGPDYPLRSTALSGPSRHFGQGLDSLFPSDEDGPRPTAPSPWPQAGARKDRKTYDESLVARSITHPHEFPVEQVDPRELHATQPSVTRGGVKHYMEGGKDYGKQNGGDHRLGNDVPRIYHRLDDDKKILLSGHHRAGAALLKGEPLEAMVVRGGWGANRD